MSLQKVTYGFIPTAISGCQLWLDAADSSTITIQTGVSQWNDKSGQGRHVTQSTTSLQPVYSSVSNALVFNSNAWLGIPNALASITPTYTIFVVDKRASASVHFFIGMHDATGGNVALVLGYNGTTTSHHTTAYITDCMVTIPAYAGAAEPKRLARYDYTGSLRDTYINGGQLSTIQSFSATLPTWNNANIGAGYYTPGVSGLDWWYVGNIHEIIFYNNVLTTAQAQQVESYLAQKWGLKSSIPADHPGLGATVYRADYTKTNIAKAIPYYTKFSPKSVPNCLIWFDAADSTTLGLTGTTVNTWTSKGSYTGNAAASTGTVVSGTVTQNGVNVVRFAAGTQLAFTMAVPNQARAWFSVTRCTTQLSQATNPSFWGIIDSPSSGAGEEAITGQVYGVPATNSYTVSLLQPGIADIVKTTTAADSYQIWTIISHVNSAVSTANNIITINGTSQTLAISSLASGYRTSSYTKIINKASLNSGMDVGEIIMYNGEITSTQRQQVESYLAQKWGLTASLPGGHLHLTQQAGAVTTVALSKYRMVGLPRISFASTGLVITHQDGRTWKATANNPGYANYAIGLNSGASMSLNIYAGSDVFNSAGGRVALFYNGDSNNAVRHAGYVMWTSTFAANNFDFGWKFVSSGSGYLIYNDYPSYSSWQVSYDSAQDRVLIVPPNDGKYGMVWNITPRVTLAYVYSSY